MDNLVLAIIWDQRQKDMVKGELNHGILFFPAEPAVFQIRVRKERCWRSKGWQVGGLRID